MNNQKGFIGIIILTIIALAATGGGYYFYKQQNNKNTAKLARSPIDESNNLSISKDKIEAIKQEIKIEPKITVTFEDQLSSCTKYRTTFKHPFTDEIMTKEILGVVDGKCDYIEQMPNGGKMECKYTESERMAVAQYYKDVKVAKSTGTSVHITSDGQETKQTINGKEIESPLQVAINNGVCVISGY